MSTVVPLGFPHPSAIEPLEAPYGEKAEHVVTDGIPQIRQRVWGLAARTDATVTFEEFIYWAKEERLIEEEENKRYIQKNPNTVGGRVSGLVRKITGKDTKELRESNANSEKEEAVASQTAAHGRNSVDMTVTNEEWRIAARALRTSSWGTIFYLITTDILGWSGAPFVFASVGYGAGVALYVIFGLAAAFAGYNLWRVFLALDSSRFPMLSFGDPFLRIYGKKSRHFINFGQSLQQFLTVAVLINGQSLVLAQLASSKICYSAVMIIIMIIGMISGSLRALQHLGWMCNLSVWLNVVSFIIILVSCTHYEPLYEVIFNSTLIKTLEPIATFAGQPPAQYQQQVVGFASQFGAINVMVYAYSGALLFVAFLAEMRHPMDFWKGLFIAQLFIGVVYIFFGVFVYSQWGQYSASNIGNVVNPLRLQQAGNVLGLLTGFFAIFLYFNIGMKTVYLEVFQEILHFPPITSRKGRFLWWGLGPMYWIVAFVVAAAVPNLNGLVGFVGGLFSLNFTYSFPAILYFGYIVQEAAALPGEGFDPVTGVTTRHDGGTKRWIRGFMKRPILAGATFIYILMALATSGMGTWAAVEGLISIFGPDGTVATSFGCSTPLFDSTAIK
ncbi:hypothetical protein B0A48_00830 [Cryoendolithus antarcticus]|uniref:Amino acid transporter transmembrane domain-containing protein n=1 Tax=Cryoendolithus antarcticus TaxID=1507870 RepID=A0A1V8TRH9_9PEZI|nr:hypothetical protein B0A48_00830 [Cryoendolithus antarcticus]